MAMRLRPLSGWWCLAAWMAILGVASPIAQGVDPATTVPPPTAAKAVITFDVGSGKVIDADNARTPLGVASTIKLLTALVVEAHVGMDDQVPITPRAANESPLKLSMEPGSHWRAGDLLHAMLIASLNDTAMALAIQAGDGSLQKFDQRVAEEATQLKLADSPIVKDPAGLDGPESVGGGNVISARDLAIVTRAFLRNPQLAAIVRLHEYRFQGGDGRPHVVYTHNAFLSIYPDAIGVKTGYTDRSGHSLVAAATRNGRTLATVVIDSPDPVGVATAHLDAAFAMSAEGQGTGDTLPDPAPPTTTVPPTTEAVASAVAPAPTKAAGASPDPWPTLAVIALIAAVVATLGLRVRRRPAAGSDRP